MRSQRTQAGSKAGPPKTESADRRNAASAGPVGNQAMQQSLHGLGPGTPLSAAQRDIAEARLATPLGTVRLHTGTHADAFARGAHARAVTDGAAIALRSDAHRDGTPEPAILGHELVHIAQHARAPYLGPPRQSASADAAEAEARRHGGDVLTPGPALPLSARPDASLHRWADGNPNDRPKPTLPPEATGLPTPEESAKDPSKMTGYLAKQSNAWADQQKALDAQPGDTPEQREAMRNDLMHLVRLSAIGLMSSHRAHIEAARDRLLAQQKGPGGAQQPDRVARAHELENIRSAAGMARNLAAVKERLETYRSGLHAANSDTLFHRGNVGDVFSAIVANGSEFMDEEHRAPLRTSFQALRESSSPQPWLFAYGATEYLENWRNQQIAGVDLANSDIYNQYPMLAALGPTDIPSDMPDEKLQQAAEAAYASVLAHVDDAIGRIAADRIHPFDMPKAVENTRAWLTGARQTALDEAVKDREVTRFWIGIGLSLFETLVVFIPVVGPIIAVGTAAVALGLQLDDMLERAAVARAGTDPNSNPVGVSAPGAFEWLMLGVGAILTAAGGAAIGRSLRGALRAPPVELLGEIGEPVSVSTGHPVLDPRPEEIPYRQPDNVSVYRGRPIDLNAMQPGQKYLWIVEEDGSVVIANEQQAPADYPTRRPPGEIKHGDLAPGPGGEVRGQARAGGEAWVEIDPVTGKRRVVMDNNSSYTFRRMDPNMQPLPHLGPDSMRAVRRLLAHYGTDVSGVVLRDYAGNPIPP